ncbi:hypothetical protein Taro_054725, partial [Colocasia esculenta]|nr:hypothetical protein [Colocasia esculenta]
MLKSRNASSFTTLVLLLILSSTWGSARGDRSGGFVRSEEEVKWLFEEWQVKHDKSYQDLGEKQKRLEIFKNNLLYIDEKNRPEHNHSFTVGLNNLADLTNEEYRSIYLSPPMNMSELFGNFIPDLDLPSEVDQVQQASIDWRDMGAVTPVKNQDGCASCWAFTAVATVEGINAIVTGDLISLSEQEIVDCDDLGTHCQPGWTSRAYDYIQRNMGIDTDANYPYTAQQGVCKADRNQVVTIDGHANAPRNNEMALSRLVARQPVGSAVDATDFQLYQGGIFKGPCTTTVNHAVTIVGYDSEAGEDYWIIKNSYGQGWCSVAMQIVSLLWLLVLILSTTWGSAKGDRSSGGFIRSEEEVKWLFEEWQVKHDKSYQDLGEKQKRLEIFKNNLQYIDQHNRPEHNHSVTVGLNNLADLTNEEYRSIYLSPKLNMSRLFHNLIPDLDLPTEVDQPQASIDWRDMGAVGPVKNQGGCASCWAFTAVATVEGINAIVTGNLIFLSEQEIVDCDDLGTHCKPGWISRAYDYIQRNMGIDTEANYPYTAQQGVCKADRNQEVTIDGYAYAPRNNERAVDSKINSSKNEEGKMLKPMQKAQEVHYQEAHISHAG